MFEEGLFAYLSGDAALSALVADRVYPMTMPQNPTLPAITYQRISTQHPETLGGSAGVDLPWLQFRCWARTYNGSRAIMEALLDALRDFRGGMDGVVVQATYAENRYDDYEPDTKLYGLTVEFRFCHEVMV